MAIDSSGKIVAAGTSGTFSTGLEFAVARYNTDGSLDTSFDSDGKTTTGFSGASSSEGFGVVIDANGKIVVAGYTDFPNTDFAVVRYNTDGSLDTGFDGDGKTTTDFGGSNESANSVAIDSSGKIVVGGGSFTSSDDFAVARYNTDGSLDTSFNTDGRVTTDMGSDDFGYGVAIDSFDRIVLAGSASNFAVARYIGTDLIVNKTADTNDGSCDPLDCSLREAIAAANAAATDDIIYFASTLTGNITLTSQLDIANNGSLSINGLTGGAGITISGNNSTRVFSIATGATADFNYLTISNGSSSSSNGGGIVNRGTLTINNSTISSNTSSGFSGGIDNLWHINSK
ncbi:MAG: delta-60 repeat domain-containing protein [Pyrinomonadaceae bacterium]